jgi:hypothetical protein
MANKFLTLVLLCLVAACSPNHSGTYVAIEAKKKSYKVDESGERVGGGMFGFGSLFSQKKSPQLTTKYEYIVNETVLSIKHDGDTFDGSLAAFSGGKLVKFTMESGYIDEAGMMHFKFHKDSGLQGGLAAGPLSLSGALGGVLLEFDQVPSVAEDEVRFDVRMNMNALGQNKRSKKQEFSFSKTGDLTKAKIIKKYTNRLIESEKLLYKKELDAGNQKAAEVHKDLILSLNGDLGS